MKNKNNIYEKTFIKLYVVTVFTFGERNAETVDAPRARARTSKRAIFNEPNKMSCVRVRKFGSLTMASIDILTLFKL